MEIPHPRKNRGSTIIRYKIVPKHHRSEDIFLKCKCLLSHDCLALIRILVGPILSESHHNSLLCAIQRSDMRWQSRTGMAVINSDCKIIHTKLRISAWQLGTYKKPKKNSKHYYVYTTLWKLHNLTQHNCCMRVRRATFSLHTVCAKFYPY